MKSDLKQLIFFGLFGLTKLLLLTFGRVNLINFMIK